MLVFSKKTIAVKTLKSDFLSSQECESVTNFLTSELSRMSTKEKVIAWSDLEEMVKQMGDASTLSTLTPNDSIVECLNDKCLLELGGALGVEKIFVTDVARVGKSTIVNMRVIDMINAESKSRSSLRVRDGMDGILDGIPSLLMDLGYVDREEDGKEGVNNRELGRKQEAATKAAVLASSVQSKSSMWLRYGGLGLVTIGGVIAYLSDKSIQDANQNASTALENSDSNAYDKAFDNSNSSGVNRNIGFGLLALGVIGFGVSFTF